ncbi:MAG: DUF1360 domain-containing protein [Alphaproteobacteria bacterium]|nr:DUF1360 domain-containing protein [Alphaproteobacteria bacterium]MCK5556221.1 DUF1360 domain-containing protein [Alphaproteobacteria bacterium]
MSDFSIEMRFLLCVLATWRMAHFLVAEDGPWDIVVKLRSLLGDSLLGAVMDCFYCLSVWLAFPLAFVITQDVFGWFISWMAISGGAALLEQASQRETSNQHHSLRQSDKEDLK